MTLQAEFDAVRKNSSAVFAPKELEVLDRFDKKTVKLKGGFPYVGKTIPPFALPDRNGRIVSSSDLLEGKEKLFVVFFRGAW